jgi:D-alanyl-lipoteichoic acid acyltransferase DltB (MBOAT superfamily)
MLFNSLEFLFFLPLVFILYWLLDKKGIKFQNILLLVASYYFYACWDWRFLFLLIFSTGLDYYTGLKMYESNTLQQRKIWFWLSIIINLGFLGVFKYYNFFADSFASLLMSFGFHVNVWTLQIILPVGISFYTFHGLSYVVDIYKERITPEKNIVTYSLFVSYFPLLVAGPIERATHLLPQIKSKRTFNYELAVSGVKQIVWGLFKKVVMADNCAFFVNKIFENPELYSSGELFVGMVFFAFQIYGDFSGYSDIALGTSKLFGIDLLKNFNFPYFSRDIAEFWRRWHISLSSWFRDYVYIPLGGSKGTKWFQIRNVMIIFLLSGFWHGANWTFIVWGAFHGLLFLPLLIANKNRNNLVTDNFTFKDAIQVIFTFLLVCIGWVFFRADSISLAVNYLIRLFSFESFELDFFIKHNRYLLTSLICLLSIFIIISTEYFHIIKKHIELKLPTFFIVLLVVLIFFLGSFKNQLDFIYFQF